MAQLRSHDTDCPSILSLEAGKMQKMAEQDWQRINIVLTCGHWQASLLDNENCILCRRPTDEIRLLLDELELLIAGRKQSLLFEPSEPSFELTFAVQRSGSVKVEAWLDAGNSSTGIYCGDAMGIRLMTDTQNLQAFMRELAAEADIKLNGAS